MSEDFVSIMTPETFKKDVYVDINNALVPIRDEMDLRFNAVNKNIADMMIIVNNTNSLINKLAQVGEKVDDDRNIDKEIIDLSVNSNMGAREIELDKVIEEIRRRSEEESSEKCMGCGLCSIL